MNLSKNKSYKQTINRKPNSTKPKKGSNIHEHIPYEHINRKNLSQHYYTEQCYLNFQNHQTQLQLNILHYEIPIPGKLFTS